MVDCTTGTTSRPTPFPNPWDHGRSAHFPHEKDEGNRWTAINRNGSRWDGPGSWSRGLGLGTAPLASIFWGNDEARGVATAARAVERGIRLFDSAPLYGLGESETRLGRALSTISRDDVVVATKAGRSLIPSVDPDGRDAVFDFSREATLRQLESSLERLGLDRVDIVHIHDPEDHLAEAIEGTYAALDQLRTDGVVGAVSLGTNVVETARFFLRNADLDV